MNTRSGLIHGISFCALLLLGFTALQPVAVGADGDKPFLGIYFAEDDSGTGTAIGQCIEGQPAASAGWKPGDRIISIAGVDVKSREEIYKVLSGLEVGAEITVKLMRGEETVDSKITLGSKTAFAKKTSFEGLDEHLDEAIALEEAGEAIAIGKGQHKKPFVFRKALPGKQIGGLLFLEEGDAPCKGAGKGDCGSCSKKCDTDCKSSDKKAVRIYRKSKKTGKAFLGVKIAPADCSVLVAGVLAGSPARAAGIFCGDRIVSVNGKEVESPDKLIACMNSVPLGKRVVLKILRDGQLIKKTVNARPTGGKGLQFFGDGRKTSGAWKILRSGDGEGEARVRILRRGECGGGSESDCGSKCEIECEIKCDSKCEIKCDSKCESACGDTCEVVTIVAADEEEDCDGEGEDDDEDDDDGDDKCFSVCTGGDAKVITRTFAVPGGEGKIAFSIAGDGDFTLPEDIDLFSTCGDGDIEGLLEGIDIRHNKINVFKGEGHDIDFFTAVGSPFGNTADDGRCHCKKCDTPRKPQCSCGEHGNHNPMMMMGRPHRAHSRMMMNHGGEHCTCGGHGPCHQSNMPRGAHAMRFPPQMFGHECNCGGQGPCHQNMKRGGRTMQSGHQNVQSGHQNMMLWHRGQWHAMHQGSECGCGQKSQGHGHGDSGCGCGQKNQGHGQGNSECGCGQKSQGHGQGNSGCGCGQKSQGHGQGGSGCGGGQPMPHHRF
jgi:hypothetical protein